MDYILWLPPGGAELACADSCRGCTAYTPILLRTSPRFCCWLVLQGLFSFFLDGSMCRGRKQCTFSISVAHSIKTQLIIFNWQQLRIPWKFGAIWIPFVASSSTFARSKIVWKINARILMNSCILSLPHQTYLFGASGEQNKNIVWPCTVDWF